jgi:hypothetical protein
MTDVDWHKILVAYIRHVGEMEGVDFLGRRTGCTPIDGLDTNEMDQLIAAAEKARESPEPT